jgi:hypothetical protein
VPFVLASPKSREFITELSLFVNMKVDGFYVEFNMNIVPMLLKDLELEVSFPRGGLFNGLYLDLLSMDVPDISGRGNR